MGKIHVNRNRQTIGQFTEEEVSEGLKSSRFLPDDLAWREHMETWLPLSEFPEFSAQAAGETAEVPENELPPPVLEPAWERRSQIGFLTAIVDTVWQVLSNSILTFKNMKPDGGFGAPFLFFIIISWVTQSVSFFYLRIILSALGKNQNIQPAQMGLWKHMIDHPVFFTAMVVPLVLVLLVCAVSVFYHVCLMVFGGARKPFETTFRVCAYALGAVSVFKLIPLCGDLIFLVYLVIVLCIGLKEAHQTTYSRAIGTVGVSVFLYCGLAMGSVLVDFVAAMHNIK